MVGCFETKVKKSKAAVTQNKFGAGWKFVDNYSSAPKGRIWIGWKSVNVTVSVLQSSGQLIHCHIQDRNTIYCYGTFVYGLHTTAERKPLWDHLKAIYVNLSGPWIILGDFNSILSAGDRINGAPVHQHELIDFQQCIEDIGVWKITKQDCQFSWSNKRDVDERIYSHIDWAFGNSDWFQTYAGVEAVYLLPRDSDHSPIMLNTVVSSSKENYRETVRTVWTQQIQGHTMFKICKKLKMLKIQMRNIHKEFSSIGSKLESLRKKLGVVQRALNEDHFNPALIEEEKLTLTLIEKWDAIQERVLRQRSKAIWIAQGDSNSKYFHSYLKARQARNKVSCIYNEQKNTRLTELDQIRNKFISFFKKLMGEAAPTLLGWIST
ncbi:PREDICTED: uncharacterized protein LOC109243918 [Nicotiana attenuata]|uniref:uncharacterized protein LOC109243918 n=1 Tax=Nicotiana attenuata TaxID=49451 RepID=UPI0009058B0E|nr:PREDICTED: uncharacterized protein LOC109243918 [Nicotiana attenuata]